MPAINPPTGLGGLVPFGGAPLSYPTIAIQAMNAPANVVQSVGNATTVSGPASYTLSFASTQVGSTLVVFVAVNASAGAALGATPAGWSLIFSQVVATLAFGCYVYYNNPGGITTFTLSSPTATTGGIAGIGSEIADCPFLSDTNLSATGSSTAITSNASRLSPPATNNVVIGALAWVLGTAVLSGGFTGNTSPPGQTPAIVPVVQQSSTGGTTNVALAFEYWGSTAVQATPATGYTSAGTLSVSAVWCGGILNLRSLSSDYSVGSSNQDPERFGTVIAGGQQAISVGAL